MNKHHLNELSPALIDRGQLQICLHVQEQMSTERASLERLRAQPASFLNSYDRLFRHISLFVLEDGLMLSALRPHQTLTVFCEAILPKEAVKHMILKRHVIKKFGVDDFQILMLEEIAMLCDIIAVFDSNDAEACREHYQIKVL